MQIKSFYFKLFMLQTSNQIKIKCYTAYIQIILLFRKSNGNNFIISNGTTCFFIKPHDIKLNALSNDV